MTKKPGKYEQFDRKKLLRKENHLTRPPRLEGVVKEAGMRPVRKDKRIKT